MTTVKTSPAELHRQLGVNLFEAAYQRGMSLSAFLETEDPSSQYNDGLDAFQRQLHVAGIFTSSVPEWGINASEWGDFTRNEQTRALALEWIARLHRSVATGRPATTRNMYMSNDNALGSVTNPYTDRPGARWNTQISAAIPISELVALTTQIDSNAYRAYYLTQSTAETRMSRIGEAAEFPRYKLVGGDRTIHLFKYGGALETSYEQARRQRLDRIALHLQQIAVQAEVDKLTVILNTLINGDGNANTAASVIRLVADLGGTANTLTVAEWLAFKMKFATPYSMITAIAREDAALDLMLVNTGSANTPLVSAGSMTGGFGSFQPINPGLADGVRLGWTADAPASKIVAIDTRFAIERVVERGANIQEVARFITNQTEVTTISEVEGYAVIDANATKILDLAN